MEEAAQQAADARVRAEAAERAVLDARAQIADAVAVRPVDATAEAERAALVARIDRIERAAAEAAEAAAQQRVIADAERTRASRRRATG